MKKSDRPSSYGPVRGEWRLSSGLFAFTNGLRFMKTPTNVAAADVTYHVAVKVKIEASRVNDQPEVRVHSRLDCAGSCCMSYILRSSNEQHNRSKPYRYAICNRRAVHTLLSLVVARKGQSITWKQHVMTAVHSWVRGIVWRGKILNNLLFKCFPQMTKKGPP